MRLSITMLVTFILFSTKIGMAQPDEGSILLGGNVSFSSSSEEEAGEETFSSSSFSIMPQAGYFVSESFVVGLGAGYETNSSTNPNFQNQNVERVSTTNTFRVAPFGRYYVGLGDNISFFAQGEFGYASGSTTVEVDGDEQDFEPSTTTLDFSLSPGFTIFADGNLGINFFMPGVISYNNSSEELNQDGDEHVETDFGVNFNTSAVGIGVDFYL